MQISRPSGGTWNLAVEEVIPERHAVQRPFRSRGSGIYSVERREKVGTAKAASSSDLSERRPTQVANERS